MIGVGARSWPTLAAHGWVRKAKRAGWPGSAGSQACVTPASSPGAVATSWNSSHPVETLRPAKLASAAASAATVVTPWSCGSGETGAHSAQVLAWATARLTSTEPGARLPEASSTATVAANGSQARVVVTLSNPR